MLWGFTMTLGYSRMMMAEAATDQKLGTLLRMHEAAFQRGSVPEEILYDRMKTVWTGTDERGEIVWNAVFLDFARWLGIHAAAVPPLPGADEGKVESGAKYVRRNFLCGLQGREPSNLVDLNAELRRWVSEVANQRVHGTTREQVLIPWDEARFSMQPVNGRLPYPYADDEQRKVARDAYVFLAGQPLFGSLALCGQRGLGSRARPRCRSALRYRTHCQTRASGQTPSGGHSKRASRRHLARQQANRQNALPHSTERSRGGAAFAGCL